MRYGHSKRAFALGLIAGLSLTVAAVAQDTAPAAGDGVTFVNSSKRHINVYARFGAGDSCSDKTDAQTVSLGPGQTVSVASGDASVCFCMQVPVRRTCASGWGEVAAGGTRTLR